MLEALGTYQCGESNQSGLIKLEYLPTAWVDNAAYQQLISSGWNWQIDIPITTGNNWLTVNVQALREKQLWNEDQRRDLSGKYYIQTITAQVPHLKPTVSKTMNDTADYRFLLRLTDRNNQKWIIGTLQDPFDFKAKGTTGGNGSLKHHAIEFKAITKRKAYGFAPVL